GRPVCPNRARAPQPPCRTRWRAPVWRRSAADRPVPPAPRGQCGRRSAWPARPARGATCRLEQARWLRAEWCVVAVWRSYLAGSAARATYLALAHSTTFMPHKQKQSSDTRRTQHVQFATMTTARTGSGDDGYTDLLGGRRVAKYDPIPVALGEVDEATSALGVAKATLPPDESRHALARRLIEMAQHDLYELMAELAFPPEHAQAQRIDEGHVARLDAAIAEVQASVPVARRFILPGACRESAAIDLARAVVRRAERAV